MVLDTVFLTSVARRTGLEHSLSCGKGHRAFCSHSGRGYLRQRNFRLYQSSLFEFGHWMTACCAQQPAGADVNLPLQIATLNASGRFPDLSAHGVEEAVLRRFLTFPRRGYGTSGVSAG